MIKRRVFLESGGFNENYLKPSIEDIELGMRLSEKGREIRLFPALQVKHNKAWTISNWLKTDLMLRGIPWVRLMATRKQWLSQLNLTSSHQLSAVIALLLVPAIPAALFYPALWWGFLLLLLAFILLNFSFFRFLGERAGYWKAMAMLPLHILYYLVASLSLALGLVSAVIHGPLENQPGM